MAELHIIGQLLRAVDFAEPHLYCKWSLQSGIAWQLVQGEAQGQTCVSAHRLETCSDFSHPLDIHLSTISVQGWPKLHVEVYAVNALHNSWPVGYGFVHVPCRPGAHRVEVPTWKLAPTTWWDSIKEKFGGGGVSLCNADLIFTGLERYKLQTRSSGRVIFDLNVVFRYFQKFGIEYD